MIKLITLAVTLLFIGLAFAPSINANIQSDLVEKSNVSFNGITIYVGGIGPGNYSSIQDAIDNSTDDDTVFVYDDSSPYSENLTINKLITLKGENKETTIIDGTEVKENVVNIFADNVNILDFTIQRYCNNDSNSTSLIYIQSDHNNISDNILKGNVSYGITVSEGDFNIIANNIINDNITFGFFGFYCNYSYIFNNFISVNSGIFLTFSNGNKIVGNILKECYDGIVLGITSDNYIYKNLISNSEFSGINSVFFSENNNISMNEISYNGKFGIILSHSKNDIITKNNFIKNKRQAFFLHSQLVILFISKELGIKPFIPKIIWDENYWYNKNGPGPKLILGRRGFLSKIPWISFDWNPAQEPYDI